MSERHDDTEAHHADGARRADPVTDAKAALRRRLLAARARRDAAERRRVDGALGAWAAAVPGDPSVPVCCYVGVGAEPGTVALLAALTAAGRPVLLPLTPPGSPSALGWARYTCPSGLRRGRFGLSEPAGPDLGADAIADATILVPALAVDQRGVRLGRGAGYYDRSLLGIDDVRLIAVVHDDEVLSEVPGDALDVRVGWALTPDAGLRRLDHRR